MTDTKQAIIKKEKIASESDGLEISILLCGPAAGTPKGIVQIVHGMCEHKERYIPFMEYLAANGFFSIIHDHRGHGESVRCSEDLGYFYEGGWTAMIDDIKAVTERVMISGLIVCGSPSRNSGAGIGKLVARLYAARAGEKCRPKIIQTLAFGSFNRRFRHEGSPNAWVCSDPEIVRNYDADPLCNFQFTAHGFLNLFTIMQDAYSISGWRPRNPSMPVLFISGEDDPCLLSPKKFRQAVRTMQRAGYTDVRSRLYPSMRHEILNEKGKEAVWEDVLTFCKGLVD